MSKSANEKAALNEAREKLTDAIKGFDCSHIMRSHEETGRVIGTEIWNSLVTLYADRFIFDERLDVYPEALYTQVMAISRGIVLSLVSQCM